MTLHRRSFFRSLLALPLALLAATAFAQAAGRDYTLIEPAQPTDNPGKIEVVEFFSYGCPHCNDFHPLLNAWVAKLPSDVVVKKVPVSFGRHAWANLARFYYALEATGEVGRLDGEVFKAIHQERVNFIDEKSITEWASRKGVDAKKFADAFGSFGVMSRVKRGDQMAQAYRIGGVPSLAVDGKYLVGGNDFNETLAIADKLIAKVRAEKSKK